MSSGAKIPLKLASASARELAVMVGMDRFETWEIAGSVRRGCDYCGDVEHVVVPRHEDRRLEGALFGGEVRRVNLVHERLDALLAEGLITKAVYGQSGATRWGPRYRGLLVGDQGSGIRDQASGKVGEESPLTPALSPAAGAREQEKIRGPDARATKHEVFLCTPETLGNTLAIRTGPAELSMRLVQMMGLRGYRCRDGRVLDLGTGRPVDCPDEQTFFSMCGVPYCPPAFRDDLLRDMVRQEKRDQEAGIGRPRRVGAT